jgi:hypothetical protein
MQVNIATVHRLRGELRAVLPELQPGHMVSNETLSACFSLLNEAVMLRLIQEIQAMRRSEVGVGEAAALIQEVSKTLSDAMVSVVLKHVPDATTFYTFRPPQE